MNTISCPECGSYAVEETKRMGDEAEYCCEDCGHYFIDAAKEDDDE